MTLPDIPPVTPALLEQLDGPVPRYTSYPTADRFGPLAAADAVAALARADASDTPLALYVHTPFCASMCAYCGCAVVVSKDADRKAAYVARLKKEIDLVVAHLPRRRRVREVHFGGGTPNTSSPAVLGDLLAHLCDRFVFDEDAELSIEIDPRQATPGQVQALRALGFSRLSLGVQDFDDTVQRAIGRLQPAALTQRVVEEARAAGFVSVNFDLIYGLPHQTPESFRATVDRTIALRPDRIALFSFAFVPHVRPNQNRIDRAALPASSTKLALFCDARAAFLAAGWRGIGMDHFARPTDPLTRAFEEGKLSRSFQGYAIAGGDDAKVEVLGFGMSAISDVGGAYLQNAKDLPAYERAIDAGVLPTVRGAVLSDDDEARRFAIRELMCRFRLDDDALRRATGRTLAGDFAGALAQLGAWETAGLVRLSPGVIEVTPLGRLFVRVVAAAFDAGLTAPAPTAASTKNGLPVWSRAV